MTASEFLAEVDSIVAGSVAQSKFKPCCSKGCSTCCSEPLMACDTEVDHMLDGLTEEHRARVTEKTKAWVEKAKPFFNAETRDGLINSYPYLEADIPCPFLEGSLCSVYERRPMGCRTYMAMGDPANCKMPMRQKQLISEFDFGHPKWTILFYKRTLSIKRFDMDHLGTHLARKLLGEDHQTSVRRVFEV